MMGGHMFANNLNLTRISCVTVMTETTYAVFVHLGNSVLSHTWHHRGPTDYVKTKFHHLWMQY